MAAGAAGWAPPWDHAGPHSAAAYAWDAPLEKSRVLRVEFQQGGKWEAREYPLDEFANHRHVRLTRRLPDLSRPTRRGYALQKKVGALTDTWRRRYCVLKGQVLYIFRDAKNLELKGVVYLGATDAAAGAGGGGRGGRGARGTVAAVYQLRLQDAAPTGDLFGRVGAMMDDAVSFLLGDELVHAPGGGGGGAGSSDDGTALARPGEHDGGAGGRGGRGHAGTHGRGG
ncbi:unnamed protein product, partial [Phaeothamnion confervicola]